MRGDRDRIGFRIPIDDVRTDEPEVEGVPATFKRCLELPETDVGVDDCPSFFDARAVHSHGELDFVVLGPHIELGLRVLDRLCLAVVD